MVRSNRLVGMAGTRAMSAACSGCRSAANRNNEWIAASRALRLRALLPRACSRWSRNAPISGASRSSKSKWDGLQGSGHGVIFRALLTLPWVVGRVAEVQHAVPA
jgi:hypothetical protein